MTINSEIEYLSVQEEQGYFWETNVVWTDLILSTFTTKIYVYDWLFKTNR